MRDTILEILEDIGEDVDFDTCETLIDDGILSSLDIIQLIGALNDEFDISIPATEIIPGLQRREHRLVPAQDHLSGQ